MFWNTFIYLDFLELFKPVWQTTRRVSSYLFVVVILFGFSVSVGPCDEFPRTFSLILSLLVDAGSSLGFTASCDEDVGDVSEDELEVPVDKPGTTIGTQFAVLHYIRLPSLMRCGF